MYWGIKARLTLITSEEKLVYSHPVPTTHISTSIEYEVHHLLSYRKPHELMQSKVASAKLKIERPPQLRRKHCYR